MKLQLTVSSHRPLLALTLSETQIKYMARVIIKNRCWVVVAQVGKLTLSWSYIHQIASVQLVACILTVAHDQAGHVLVLETHQQLTSRDGGTFKLCKSLPGGSHLEEGSKPTAGQAIWRIL